MMSKLRVYQAQLTIAIIESLVDQRTRLRRIFQTSDISPEQDGTLMKKFLSKGDGETMCRAFDEVVLQVDQVTEPWQSREGPAGSSRVKKTWMTRALLGHL